MSKHGRLIDADALLENKFSNPIGYTAFSNLVKRQPTVDPEQPEVLSDGTLHITVDMDISKINRILMSQKGTHCGNLFYVDGGDANV